VTDKIGSYVRVSITRFVDAHQPGFVECALTDRFGRQWLFVEKIPVVTEANLWKDSEYPQRGFIACMIVSRGHDDNGRPIAEIDTEHPWSIETSEGVTRFHVLAEQLSDTT